MKYILTLFFVFILVSINFAQANNTDSSQTLNDVIVKETYESNTGEEKLPLQFQYDFSLVVQIPERVDWTSIDKDKEDLSHKDWDSFSFQLSMPEFARIHPAPVKVFRVEFKDISRWKLQIFSSDGSLFRCIEGDGNPPEHIAWDGLSDDNKPLIPGQNYSYSFTPIDKAGNKKIFPGQTFTIPAYYLEQENAVRIGIAASKLFSYDGLVMLENADEYANEVASLIRYYGISGDITVESTHPRRMDFIQLVLDQLKRNQDTQSTSASTGNQEKMDCVVYIE